MVWEPRTEVTQAFLRWLLAFMVKKLKVADFGAALFLDEDIQNESVASFGLAALQMPKDKVRGNQAIRISIRSAGDSKSVNYVVCYVEAVSKVRDNLRNVGAT